MKVDTDFKEYVVYLGNKIQDLQKRVGELEKFKKDFVQRKSYKKANFSYDLEPGLLAKYFSKSYENMRSLKAKYKKSRDENSTWVLYCKSYYFDKILEGSK